MKTINEETLRDEFDSQRTEVLEVAHTCKRAGKYLRERLDEFEKILNPDGLLYEHIQELMEDAISLYEKADNAIKDLELTVD